MKSQEQKPMSELQILGLVPVDYESGSSFYLWLALDRYTPGGRSLLQLLVVGENGKMLYFFFKHIVIICLLEILIHSQNFFSVLHGNGWLCGQFSSRSDPVARITGSLLEQTLPTSLSNVLPMMELRAASILVYKFILPWNLPRHKQWCRQLSNFWSKAAYITVKCLANDGTESVHSIDDRVLIFGPISHHSHL